MGGDFLNPPSLSPWSAQTWPKADIYILVFIDNQLAVGPVHVAIDDDCRSDGNPIMGYLSLLTSRGYPLQQEQL